MDLHIITGDHPLDLVVILLEVLAVLLAFFLAVLCIVRRDVAEAARSKTNAALSVVGSGVSASVSSAKACFVASAPKASAAGATWAKRAGLSGDRGPFGGLFGMCAGRPKKRRVGPPPPPPPSSGCCRAELTASGTCCRASRSLSLSLLVCTFYSIDRKRSVQCPPPPAHRSIRTDRGRAHA